MVKSRMRWLWFRPTTYRMVFVYTVAMLAVALAIGLVAGRPNGWLFTAGGVSTGTLLAGLLHVASRPEPETAPTRPSRLDV